MSKRWDSLRAFVKPPISGGEWNTTTGAKVRVSVADNARLFVGPESNYFMAEDLRQLSEFCNELADQLDGE